MFEFTTPQGKLNWPYIRQIVYCLIFVWLVGVRMMNINPFDDFGDNGKVTLATGLDFLSLFAIYIVTWHVLYPGRPRIS